LKTVPFNRGWVRAPLSSYHVKAPTYSGHNMSCFHGTHTSTM